MGPTIDEPTFGAWGGLVLECHPSKICLEGIRGVPALLAIPWAVAQG